MRPPDSVRERDETSVCVCVCERGEVRRRCRLPKGAKKMKKEKRTTKHTEKGVFVKHIDTTERRNNTERERKRGGGA